VITIFVMMDWIRKSLFMTKIGISNMDKLLLFFKIELIVLVGIIKSSRKNSSKVSSSVVVGRCNVVLHVVVMSLCL